MGALMARVIPEARADVRRRPVVVPMGNGLVLAPRGNAPLSYTVRDAHTCRQECGDAAGRRPAVRASRSGRQRGHDSTWPAAPCLAGLLHCDERVTLVFRLGNKGH